MSELEKRPLRMLYCYFYCNLGGVCSVIKQRLLTLRELGWDVTALFELDNGGSGDLLASGVSEVIIAGKGKIASALAALVAKREFDAVTIIDAPDLVGVLPEARNYALIYETHSALDRTIARHAPEMLQSADLYLTPSHWMKDTYARRFSSSGDRFVTVPNPVDEDMFYGYEGLDDVAPTRLVWIGKLDAQKNWKQAVRVFHRLHQKHPGIGFDFITGGGADPAVTVDFLNELFRLDIDDAVKWYHRLMHSDLAELLRTRAQAGAICFVTSLAESFCLAVHESLRCGLVVVAPGVGAIPELIEHDSTGLLFDGSDDDDALVQLERALTDAGARARFRQNTAPKLVAFEREAIMSRYVNLIYDAT